jgi:hypothetical protein
MSETKKHHSHEHHHDEHHHHHSGGGERRTDYAWATWAFFLCLGLIVVFFVIAAVALGRTEEVHHTMNAQMAAKQEELDNHIDSLPFTDRLFPLASVLHLTKPRVLNLCALTSYYATSGGPNEPLNRLTESIDDIRSAKMSPYKYTHLSSRLRLIFNAKIHTEGKKHKKKKLFTLQYNLTSSFIHFSSVKLQELEFDTLSQSVGPLREILLCSNNPALNNDDDDDDDEDKVPRCDALLSKRNLLVIHGQKILPIVIARKPFSVSDPPLPPNDTSRLKEQAVYNLDEDDDEEEDDENEEKKYKQNQKEDLLGLRMYNLVFYQIDEGAISTKTRNNVTSLYKEHRVITIEPDQC